MSQHHIPDPPGQAVHTARVDCPCGPAVTVGPRADGSFGVVAVHRDWTDLIDDRHEESDV